MGAHVFEHPNSGKATVWQVRCYDHHKGGEWYAPTDHPHTDAGLKAAFIDKMRHNRVEHPNDL